MKKLLVFVALLLTLSFAQNASASFHDISQDSELNYAVEQLKSKQILSGYDDGTFRPNNRLTRAQLAKLIAVSLQLKDNSTTATFSDVPTKHANFHYIQALVSRGIISGYADGTFKPNAAVTRAQAAKMIAKAYAVPSYNAALPFTDVKVANERYADVQALYFNGIASGTSPTTYSPSQNVTRGQAALFIFRALQVKNGAKIAEITVNDLKNITVEKQEGYFYKAVIVGNKVRILPLMNGTAKLLITGDATNTTVPTTNYAMYSIKVANQKATISTLQWLDHMEHVLNYYTLKSLNIQFTPTSVSLEDQYGTQIPQQLYSVGADKTGLELVIFMPGQYTLTLKNGTYAKSFKVISTVSGFKIKSTLYAE